MDINEFITLAVVHFVTIAALGPNAVACVSNSLMYGFRAGLLTVTGICIGNVFHIIFGIFGITVIMQSYPEMTTFVTIMGSTYLLYLGVRKIRKALQQKSNTQFTNQAPNLSDTTENFLISGVILNLTNAKGFLFFVLAFTTLISPSNPLAIKIFYGAWMTVVNFLFLGTLTWIFRKRPNKITSFKHEITIHLIGGSAYVFIALVLLYPLLK